MKVTQMTFEELCRLLQEKEKQFGLKSIWNLVDIKHNRVPAPGISFEQPNLPYPITKIEREIIPSSSSV